MHGLETPADNPWTALVWLGTIQPGLTVLAPGWLAHSVLPVSPGHSLAVLTALGQTVFSHYALGEVQLSEIWGVGHRIPPADGHGAWTRLVLPGTNGQPPHDRGHRH
ncbi:hypothetical protein ACIQVK_19675 [Streptomyces sp. NPDC090493]|uniref:hypothetical protein n=1 Tax=Streptomyces sp. NPDC090493 TaxID=3365964 RepID=UPI00381CDF09